MSWEAIEKPIKGSKASRHPVSVTVKRFRGVTWMSVRINPTVLAGAKLKIGDTVAVFRGRAEDMGRLRLVKAPAGFLLMATGRRTDASPAFTRFPWPEAQAPADASAQGVAFKPTQLEGVPAIELTLPAWATAPAKSAPAGRRDVTSDLMGDPKR